MTRCERLFLSRPQCAQVTVAPEAEQDQRVDRRDAPGAHGRELVRAGDAVGRGRHRALGAGGRPGGIVTGPQQLVGADPVHRPLAHVKQRAEERGEEHDLGENEPRHAPAERAVHLLVVGAGFAFADHLAEPAEHHVHDDGGTGEHDPRAGADAVHGQDETQRQTEQAGRSDNRPRARIRQIVITVCSGHAISPYFKY